MVRIPCVSHDHKFVHINYIIHIRCIKFLPCTLIEFWRREWQPTPVFLPGELPGQRSFTGYSPWGCKESDMTEHHMILLSPSLKWHPHIHRSHALRWDPNLHIQFSVKRMWRLWAFLTRLVMRIFCQNLCLNWVSSRKNEGNLSLSYGCVCVCVDTYVSACLHACIIYRYILYIYNILITHLIIWLDLFRCLFLKQKLNFIF